MGTHEAGRSIALVGFFALYCEMNLVLAKSTVDAVYRFHQTLLTDQLICLLRRKNIQLNTVGAL